jgi:hypothetical protein
MGLLHNLPFLSPLFYQIHGNKPHLANINFLTNPIRQHKFLLMRGTLSELNKNTDGKALTGTVIVGTISRLKTLRS